MKLQNNYTTPEQNKRLLEIGVPIDTSDCYYTSHDGDNIAVLPEGISYSKFCKSIEKVLGERLFPCWSVGRLIEIMGLCYDFELQSQGAIQIYRTDIENRSVVDVLISDIERFISRLDFSKLEN